MYKRTCTYMIFLHTFLFESCVVYSSKKYHLRHPATLREREGGRKRERI